MILIGDKNIPYETLTKVSTIEELAKTKANTMVVFEYIQSLVDYCFKNNLSYGVIIKDLKEAIYSNALEAKYIICDKQLAQSIQNTADNYMFDSKVLAIIESNEEFEDITKQQIDGVIYNYLLK
ncbi:hypothetical protein AMRN_1352 [Malaciobacter marinus]|uniref:Uncharacterized protein n=1 Tax=Malaciobacter marinus TaxID=505249 RepID=A0A347TKG5_9BACT|nr:MULTISPECIES: hypothetical protein [Malaciobacter]AXX87093.1 hypothetical protein AMRN_1352 [Malaciobacter marinus]PHO12065.1 hypothetical protein CPG38_09555 [Malaciobacter marinus]PHO16304.1 hypothetical protein CPH92_02215 [Malaciobacter marinus]RYA22887.1 hypothetical protein CRU96_10565 [Malaciobacter halophilus]